MPPKQTFSSETNYGTNMFTWFLRRVMPDLHPRHEASTAETAEAEKAASAAGTASDRYPISVSPKRKDL